VFATLMRWDLEWGKSFLGLNRSNSTLQKVAQTQTVMQKKVALALRSAVDLAWVVITTGSGN
jgi:hypothetical protein